jgi:hypothetical protein
VRQHAAAVGHKPRASTHIFRVRLKPKVYRDIEIDSGKSLHDLAAAIVQAFGFDLDHAFGFFSKLDYHLFDSPVRYELFAELDPHSQSRSVKRTKVAQAFPKTGSKMQFLFDYGDDWRFQVEVIGMGEGRQDPLSQGAGRGRHSAAAISRPRRRGQVII